MPSQNMFNKYIKFSVILLAAGVFAFWAFSGQCKVCSVIVFFAT